MMGRGLTRFISIKALESVPCYSDRWLYWGKWFFVRKFFFRTAFL